ncbi:hypothetical protein [Brucella anthropi]|uniref:hypothetical protein n=1 Tax=Brucella anthropi TaxID=529 RepID=UPI000CFC0948|nr:hypothetical protein [Ochrobactrum sp. MYb49]PQZ63073.1 hypothetical protein CQ057_16775 [Ochrobactrum sp. MYb49]
MEVSEQAVGAMQAYLRLKRYILPSGIAREALQAAIPFLSQPSAAREQVLEEGYRQGIEAAAQIAERPVIGFSDGAVEASRRIASSIRALSSPDHADDLAVDRFAIAMKQKLAKKREEGRGGWENKDECSAEYLSYLLIQHIWKGDPVDIANLAMMLQQRGDRIVIDSETSSIIPDHADAGKVEGDGWLPITEENEPPMDVEVILGWWQSFPEKAWITHVSRYGSTRGRWRHSGATHWLPLSILPSAPSQEVAGS